MLSAVMADVTTRSEQLRRIVHRPPVRVRPIGGWRRLVQTVLSPGVELQARGVVVSGLRLDRVTMRLAGLSVRLGRPPVLRAGHTTVWATVAEGDANSWLAGARLPLRLRFRDAGIQARAGVAGVTLGVVDATVSLDAGVLRLAPRRLEVLGIGVSAATLPATLLPLPPLPRAARLSALQTGPRRVTAQLSLPGATMRLGPGRLRDLLDLVRSGRISVGAAPDADRTRPPRALPGAPSGATTNTLRMVSPHVVEASLAPQEETP